MKSQRLFRLGIVLIVIGSVAAFAGIYHSNLFLRFGGMSLVFIGAFWGGMAIGKGLRR